MNFYKQTAFWAVLASAAGAAAAFHPRSLTRYRTGATTMMATVDPGVITSREYEDICGVSFDDRLLGQRLEKTKFLYPKHVEVVEDFTDVVDEMVDDIVSCLSKTHETTRSEPSCATTCRLKLFSPRLFKLMCLTLLFYTVVQRMCWAFPN